MERKWPEMKREFFGKVLVQCFMLAIVVGPLHGPSFLLPGNHGFVPHPRLTMNTTSFGVGGDACPYKNDEYDLFRGRG